MPWFLEIAAISVFKKNYALYSTKVALFNLFNITGNHRIFWGVTIVVIVLVISEIMLTVSPRFVGHTDGFYPSVLRGAYFLTAVSDE